MKEQTAAAATGETCGGGEGERGGRWCHGVTRIAPGGSGSALVVFSAHGQVDKGEDIKLYHYGEAQEDSIENQHIDSQLPVQPPFIQVDAEDLEGDSERAGPWHTRSVLIGQ